MLPTFLLTLLALLYLHTCSSPCSLEHSALHHLRSTVCSSSCPSAPPHSLLSLTLLLTLLVLLLALSSHRLSGCTVNFMPPKVVDGVLTQISEGRPQQQA